MAKQLKLSQQLNVFRLILTGSSLAFVLIGILLLYYGINANAVFSGLDVADQTECNPFPGLTGHNISYGEARKYSSIGGFSAIGSSLLLFSTLLAVGVYTRREYAILAAAVFYLVLFLDELLMGATLSYMYSLPFVDNIRSGEAITRLMEGYKWNSSMDNGTLIERAPVEVLQQSLSCCGNESYLDWNGFRPTGSDPLLFPASCCASFNYKLFLNNLSSPVCSSDGKDFRKQGCRQALLDAIASLHWTGIPIVILSIAHLSMAIVACLLYRGIQSIKRREASSLRVLTKKRTDYGLDNMVVEIS